MKKVECIVIGAGIAGLAAAYKLRKEGMEVVVLESQDLPGGRMISENLDNINVNLGAGFALTSYKNLLHTAKELGLEEITQDYSRVAIVSNKKTYDFNPSNLFSLLNFKLIGSGQKIKLIFLAPLIFLNALKCRITNFKTIVSFDTESSADLFRKILGKNGVDYLADPLNASLFFYSPDFLSKGILFGMFSYVMKAHFINFKEGLGKIASKIAETLDVKYKAKVTRVVRVNEHVHIEFHINNEQHILAADRVVIAIPGNKVSRILDKPENFEVEFFKNVDYGTHVSAFFKTKDKIFPGYTKILFTLNDNYKVSSLNLINNSTSDEYYYRINFRDEYSRFLISDNLHSKEVIHASIKENFPEFNDIQVLDVVVWKSAIPKFKPGYIKKIVKFRKHFNKDSRIFYAGDYLNGPFLEGAFESGLRAAHQILRSYN